MTAVCGSVVSLLTSRLSVLSVLMSARSAPVTVAVCEEVSVKLLGVVNTSIGEDFADDLHYAVSDAVFGTV